MKRYIPPSLPLQVLYLFIAAFTPTLFCAQKSAPETQITHEQHLRRLSAHVLTTHNTPAHQVVVELPSLPRQPTTQLHQLQQTVIIDDETSSEEEEDDDIDQDHSRKLEDELAARDIIEAQRNRQCLQISICAILVTAFGLSSAGYFLGPNS